MNGAFYIGATGLRSQERGLEAIANNIANMNTPAYKRTEVRFSELLPPPQTDDVQTSVVQPEPGLSGVTSTTSARVFAQGDLRQTGNQLDLAIQGVGFFEVLGAQGAAYLWRGGALRVNADGFLAAPNGMPLKSMISVPDDAKAITIARDGLVSVTAANGESREIGKIELAVAKDPNALRVAGEGLWQALDPADLLSSPAGTDGGAELVQGSVEGSNVELSDEMVTLMLTQRAFAANAQIVQAGDQLMSIANSLRR